MSIFKDVAYNPRPGDKLNFPGGSRSYIIEPTPPGMVFAGLNADEIIVRREIIRNADEGEPPTFVGRVNRAVWADLVRFACTVERAPE